MQPRKRISSPAKSIRCFVDYYGLKLPDGAIVEFGSYDGGSTIELQQEFPDRRVIAFDTFEGMPAADYLPDLDGDGDPPGKFVPNAGVIEALHACDIETCKGRFCETAIPSYEPELCVAIASVDADWYKSYRDALAWLSSRLAHNAIVYFDEPHYPGPAKAIAE